MHLHCCHGVCKSDSRKPEAGVTFMPFPKPRNNLKIAKRWVHGFHKCAVWISGRWEGCSSSSTDPPATTSARQPKARQHRTLPRRYSSWSDRSRALSERTLVDLSYLHTDAHSAFARTLTRWKIRLARICWRIKKAADALTWLMLYSKNSCVVCVLFITVWNQYSYLWMNYGVPEIPYCSDSALEHSFIVFKCCHTLYSVAVAVERTGICHGEVYVRLWHDLLRA